jgi:hypothetical protein
MNPGKLALRRLLSSPDRPKRAAAPVAEVKSASAGVEIRRRHRAGMADSTVLIVTDDPRWWSACDEVGGAYLGLDDRGRRIYRVPVAALDFGTEGKP